MLIYCLNSLFTYNHCLSYFFFKIYFFFPLGASLIVAIQAVKKGAAAEGMKVRDYIWRGHDPTAVAVMTEVIHQTFVHSYYLPYWS